MLYRSYSFAGGESLLVMALVMLMIVGCGTTSKYPRLVEYQGGSMQERGYVIGPGDTLEIFVWGNEELSVTLPVRPDGKITTKLVEDMQASGKTPSELARDIERAYSKYVKSAVVSVIVGDFVGIPSQQIRVVGGADKPLTVPYRKHMTVLDLMIEAGGLGEFAAGNKAVLIRHVDGERKTYGLRLDDLLNDGDMTADHALAPGDIVIIPEAWF